VAILNILMCQKSDRNIKSNTGNKTRPSGGVYIQEPTVRSSTHCCIVGNGSASVAMTSRLSLSCSTQPTMTSSAAASKPTLHMFSSLTFLTRIIFHTICVLVRTHNLTMINKTKFLNDTDFIICMLLNIHTNIV